MNDTKQTGPNRLAKRWLYIALALLVAARPSFADPPNIVVFLVDDMGLMDTSVPFLTDDAGQPVAHPLNAWYRTPNMQRLADQGIRFSNFYAQSVCSPTRTSIMTGQNAARHHTTQWISPERNNHGPLGPREWNWQGLAEQDITLPRLLQDGGYRTIHIGKGHFGPIGQPGEDPTNLGFTVNIAGNSSGQPGSYYGQDGYGNLRGNARRAVPHLERYHNTDTYLTEALTLEAKDQINQAVQDEQPFFLYLPHYAVHGPFQSDPRFAPNYDDSDRDRKAQAYATMIEGMDKSLGDLLDHLETLGIADNTLILFLGDNGSDAPLGQTHGHFSSAPLRGKKGTHYEGGMRVPFIAAWATPNADHPAQQQLPIAPGQVQPQLATVMDLYPTLLALADLENPEDHTLDGYPLAPLFTGDPDPDHPEVFLMHFPHAHRSSYFTSFRQDEWKLVYHYHPDKNPANTRYELFNLADDPYENHNLADEQPEELARMTRAMIAQLEAEDAQYPIDEAGNPLPPAMP